MLGERGPVRKDEEEDDLKIYRLAEPREASVEEFGVGRIVDFRDPLVV